MGAHGVHHRPVKPAREPWPWETWLEASIQEEEQEGTQEAACLSNKKKGELIFQLSENLLHNQSKVEHAHIRAVWVLRYHF